MDTNTKNEGYSRRTVRNQDGAVLKVTDWGTAHSVEKLVEEYFNLRLVSSKDPQGDGLVLALHDDYIQPTLTVPQRAVIEAFAWYCEQYTRGLHRDQDGVSPKAILPLCDAEARRDVMPFRDEARAYQFAEVCQDCFFLEADVIQGPGGWIVVVSDDDGERIDAETLARLQGACQVLGKYAIAESEEVFASDLEQELIPSPAARQAWRDRQNAPLARIESALGEILSRLASDAATGAETPSMDLAASIATGRELVANIEDTAHRSKRTASTAKSSGKKSSVKRSA